MGAFILGGFWTFVRGAFVLDPHTTMDARCNSITHGTLGKVSKIKVKQIKDRKKTIGLIVVYGNVGLSIDITHGHNITDIYS